MNDTMQNQLKVVVERAVRPVRATIARKRRMREELLAHLVSVFEEELQRVGDEGAAFHEAKRRFGNASELSSQLQETVPRTDRLSRFLDDIWRWQAEESVLRHAVRVALFPFVWFGLILVLVPPVLLVRGRLHEIGRMELFMAAAGVVMFGGTFALTLLVHGLRESLFRGTSARSLPLAAVYSLLSALVVPFAGLVLSWVATGDVAEGYAHLLRLLWWSAILLPFVLIALARQLAHEARYTSEWANLCIEE